MCPPPEQRGPATLGFGGGGGRGPRGPRVWLGRRGGKSLGVVGEEGERPSRPRKVAPATRSPVRAPGAVRGGCAGAGAGRGRSGMGTAARRAKGGADSPRGDVSETDAQAGSRASPPPKCGCGRLQPRGPPPRAAAGGGGQAGGVPTWVWWAWAPGRGLGRAAGTGPWGRSRALSFRLPPPRETPGGQAGERDAAAPEPSGDPPVDRHPQPRLLTSRRRPEEGSQPLGLRRVRKEAPPATPVPVQPHGVGLPGEGAASASVFV